MPGILTNTYKNGKKNIAILVINNDNSNRKKAIICLSEKKNLLISIYDLFYSSINAIVFYNYSYTVCSFL